MSTDLRPLWGHMFLLVIALVVLITDTFRIRRPARWLGVGTALAAVGALALDMTAPDARLWGGIVVFDAFSRAFDVIFLSALALAAFAASSHEHHTAYAGEYFSLMAVAAVGLMLTASAGGLLMLYVGIELSTICFMGLVGFNRGDKRSAEAALKLFVAGAVTSAVTLYGMSIVYGAFGTTLYSAIAQKIAQGQPLTPVVWFGLAGVAGGLAFKVAAAPFHLWAPDVYEGAPTPIVAFLSTASKAAGFAGILRLLLGAFYLAGSRWSVAVAILAGASMLMGNLSAIPQTNAKRLLAYSGIAQAGYILVAVCGLASRDSHLGVGAVLMYLLLYVFTNIGGFLVIQAVAQATGSDDISAFNGLHKRSPLLALAMLVVLFSLGGIPPLAGFVGKVFLFAAGWEGHQYGLVLFGAVVSLVALYYYLIMAMAVYIKDPVSEKPIRTPHHLAVSIGVCTVLTLAIGIYPAPWVRLGDRAARALQGTTISSDMTARTVLPGRAVADSGVAPAANR